MLEPVHANSLSETVDNIVYSAWWVRSGLSPHGMTPGGATAG
jgi:hypothetical protein